MALTAVDYHLWHELRDEGLIPDRPFVLEFGQANWYGDVDPEKVREDIRKYAHCDKFELLRLLDESLAEPINLWGIARAFYGALLDPAREIEAVDLNGKPEAHKFDLNAPLSLPLGWYDVLINSGTAEHIFNQQQVWKSAHDHTKPGGLMVHAMPLWGWIDHGLVNYHPTFVADLAAANGYEIIKWWFAEFLTNNVVRVDKPEDFKQIAERFGTRMSAMMYVVFRKPEERREFVTPMQGYYAGRLDAEGKRAWQQDR